MRNFVLLLGVIWLAQAPVAAAESTAVNKVHARYVVLKSGIEIGEIDEVFQRNQDRYVLRSIARPLGLLALFRPGKISIRSEGTINAQGLKPLDFSYQHEGSPHKDSDAQFLWEQGELSLNHDGQHSHIDLPTGTQDRLSAMYQFMFLNLRANHSLDFAMTNGSKLDDYHYSIATGSPVNIATTTFNTLYLDSQAKNGETRTQIWLATEHHNLPCKLVITDPDGGKLTQELRQFDTQP